MEFEQLLELIRTVSASELTEFRYEEKDTKIRMEKKRDVTVVSAAEIPQAPVLVPEIPAAAGEGNTEEEASRETAGGNVIVSPLVGTFYTAPQEDAEAFVQVGDTVKKGQVLAIIEAMKLMNEIESDFDGVVTEILAANGQPVEYGQPLFRIG